MAFSGLITKRHNIDRELQAMQEEFSNASRGDLVTHEQIEAVTGLKRGKTPWSKLIRKWKSSVIEKTGIAIVSEPGVGYRFPDHAEQFHFAGRLENSANRKLRKSELVAGIMPTSELTEEGTKLQEKIVTGVRLSIKQIKINRAERRSLMMPTESLPRPLAIEKEK